MSDAVSAFLAGLRTVLVSPLLVAGITLATVASAVPFGVVLGARLQASLSQQQTVSSGAVEIDPEWWMEYRAHATGLEATFTPTILGFAAPLDNLSALLDATPRPWALAGPVAWSVLLWAFLWGGVLHRFSQGRPVNPAEFVKAGLRHLPRLVLISAVALPVYALIYLAVHPVLFDLIYERLASIVSSERDAFLIRVALYALFVTLLMGVAAVVDYARISVIVAGSSRLSSAIDAGTRFVRQHTTAVVSLYVLAGVVLAAILIAYGTGEIYGGTRLGGWRAVAIGQAYIVGRLALRLVLAASEVRLYHTRVSES